MVAIWGRFLCCILFRLCNTRTVPMLRPELLHNLPCPHAPFLFVNDCPGENPKCLQLFFAVSEYPLVFLKLLEYNSIYCIKQFILIYILYHNLLLMEGCRDGFTQVDFTALLYQRAG